ncbi:hypothetical protein [Neorhizobium sp. DAR64860/K0K1]|uniref:hypothetical protein n=1 Tax=Neorhizobium sp. DAR64860/K0K1 TaxID=3421955 RepID=UPI003D2E17DF
MVDLIKIRRAVGTAFEADALARAQDVARAAPEVVEWFPGTELALTAKHQGTALIFTAACMVTIPAGLPEGFGCAFIQAGTGQVSLQPAEGVTLNSQGNARKSETQWSVFGVSSIGPEHYLGVGGLVS